MIPPERDEERTPSSRGIIGGAAIAPPPSLQESSELPPPPPRQSPNLGYATSSVAAKIMAKYGFKEGQGLGKKEQGMSVALQVEKTSKRGGRIVGEREQLMPPPPPIPSSPPQMQLQSLLPPPEEPSITEIMKCPSKVDIIVNKIILRNIILHI
jgi:splicing factor 45